MPLLSKGPPSLKPISDSNCTVSATEYLQAQDTHRSQVGLASLSVIATVMSLLLSTCKHMAQVMQSCDSNCTVSATEYLQAQDTHRS